MANSLGQLIVRLGLDASDYTSGMSKADQLAQRFAANMDRAVAAGILKAEIALRAFGTAVRTTAETFQALTTGAGVFKDLEESTGSTAESIASLQVAASTAGTPIEDVAAAANKLTKNLVGVDDESKAAGAALGALGLNVKDFKQLDPVAQYEAVARALDGFADGAGKTAIAMALFGKQGAEQLRVMKALEEAGGRQVILTQDQIERADAYADAQAKAKAQLKLYAQAAASEAIPALTDLSATAVEVAKAFLGIDAATGKLSANNGAREWAEKAADAVAFVIDQLDLFNRLVELSMKGFGAIGNIAAAVLKGQFGLVKGIVDAAADDVRATLDRTTFGARLAQQRAASAANDANRRAEDRGFTPAGTKPSLKFNFDAGAAAEADALLRKALDGQVRAIRDFADDQKAAFDFANQVLKGSYDDGLSSLRDFYAGQAQIRAAALADQVRALDEEAAAVRQFQSRARSAQDRADAENKLADLARKRSEIVVAASRQNSLAVLEEARAADVLKRQYDGLVAQIAQLSGDTQGAARIRIAQRAEDARRLAIQAGAGPAGADRVSSLLRDRLTQTEALSQAQADYGRLLERTANAEATLLLAAVEAGTSENDTLRAVGEQRAKALQQLGALVDKANELAKAFGGKNEEANLFAERLGLAFKKASAEVDPLLQKMRDTGQEAGRTIAASLEDAVFSGRKFADILRDLDKQLAQIAFRQLVSKPFEQWLGNAIGGNGQKSGGGGWIGAAANWITGIFGGGKAIGGPTMPRTLYQVAENRPEVYDDGSRQWLLTGSRRGRIDPNPSLASAAGGAPVVQHFHFDQQPDRRTATQIGAAAARGAALANARNG